MEGIQKNIMPVINLLLYVMISITSTIKSIILKYEVLVNKVPHPFMFINM